MNKNAKIVLGLVILVVIVIVVAMSKSSTPVAPQAPAEPIKIGFLGPLTGDAAGLGENMKIAAELARDEINNAGGVNGRKIELVIEDGGCDAKIAANAGSKLVNIDKVTAIVGGACSPETLAVAPMSEQAKVPQISASSTNPAISQAGDYIFRFIPSDAFQGKFAAEHLVNDMGKKKIGILYCLNDWCTGIREVFKGRLGEVGGEVVADEGYQWDARDLRSQITKIKATNPDAVYFLGFTESTIIGLKQMKELGLTAAVVGGDAWDDPKIPQEAGVAADNVHYSIAANRALPQSFIDEMNKRTGGKEINTYAPRVYDIMKVLANIMTKVGADGEKIKAELYQVKDYQGIADAYTMDMNGDVSVANFTVKVFKDGKIGELSK